MQRFPPSEFRQYLWFKIEYFLFLFYKCFCIFALAFVNGKYLRSHCELPLLASPINQSKCCNVVIIQQRAHMLHSPEKNYFYSRYFHTLCVLDFRKTNRGIFMHRLTTEILCLLGIVVTVQQRNWLSASWYFLLILIWPLLTVSV